MCFTAFMLSLCFGYVAFRPIFFDIGDKCWIIQSFLFLQVHLVWVMTHGWLNQVLEFLLGIESMHSLHNNLNSSNITWRGFTFYTFWFYLLTTSYTRYSTSESFSSSILSWRWIVMFVSFAGLKFNEWALIRLWRYTRMDNPKEKSY